jgi:signal transduction histidine kinase
VRVGQRLFLAVVPAIVGLFTVAALAYWGHLFRAAPVWVVSAAAVAAVASLILAWQNTRYVARRIERLAGGEGRKASFGSPLEVVRDVARPSAARLPDELDSIEEVVDRLSGAVTVAEAGSREREAAASQRVQEYAALLAEATAAVTHQLDEIRLPLHILLENHFGQLNDNQEEMLAGARTATEAAATELRRLRDIAELDRGALSLRRTMVPVGDVLRGLRPQLEAEAERAGVTLGFDQEPGLPRVAGDRSRLQEALELLLRGLVRRSLAGSEIRIEAARAPDGIDLRVIGGPSPILDADTALARRIVQAHGGRLEYLQDRTVLFLPAAGGPVPDASSRGSSPVP